ncbi:MAG: N-acetyl sugar amidotransferase, partial [Gammaproteobacteria bacterium]|nr:N-acetyl sugar amidotransferase [Gammaproteobacteria bacterium]
MLKPSDYAICARCVADTIADPEITFNSAGVCRYCALHDALAYDRKDGLVSFEQVAQQVRASGEGKEYDCLIGLSGGVDSSYVTHLAHINNLRPLVVHFDNGWNSELAVDNIKRILNVTKFDLHTLVVNWAEFVDIQRSFFKASVVDIEIVTDHAITATMMNLAREFDIKYILSGSNQATESGMPSSWSWRKQDWVNIRAIHCKFGSEKIKTFPQYGTFRMFYDRFFGRRLMSIPILDHIEYRKDEAVKTLVEKYGWRAYGGKHYESVFTKFYQAYVLPTKFHIDKRKSHLSSLIRNGEMSREEAMDELRIPLYSEQELQLERAFVLKKLEFGEDEFAQIMRAPSKLHTDFRSDESLLKLLRILNKWGLKRLLARRTS